VAAQAMSVGKKFVDVQLVSTVDGTKHKLSALAGKGQPVVLCVYSSSVPDCAPALQALEEHAFSKKHIVFVALNVEDSAGATKDFLRAQGVRSVKSFTGKVPLGKAGYAVRDGALPFHVVIDESGKVLHCSEDSVADQFMSLVA
jgi:peroxiredoxin